MISRRIFFFFLAVALDVIAARAQNYFNPVCAVSSAGTTAIAFNAAPSNGGAVSIILVDTSGSPVVSAWHVNGAMPGYGQNPSVAFVSGERFAAVWEQWHGDVSSIYLSWGGRDSSLRTRPACVTDSAGMSAQTPRVAAGIDGRLVVVWVDYRLGHPAVFAQRYRKDGAKEGKNFRVSGTTESMRQTPAVCVGSGGELGIVWQETIRDSFRVVFRSVSWRAMSGISPVVLDESMGQAYASTPEIAALGRTGEYVVVWKDYRTGESNIYVQRVTRSGKKRGGNIRVNDDSTSYWQRLPQIAASARGVLIVWEDYRNDPANQVGDIYAQRLGTDGRFTGPNFLLTPSLEPAIQRFPDVCMNARGDYCVVWSDNRRNELHDAASIYLRCGKFGITVPGPERQISP